jgi:hypothetical protein
MESSIAKKRRFSGKFRERSQYTASDRLGSRPRPSSTKEQIAKRLLPPPSPFTFHLASSPRTDKRALIRTVIALAKTTALDLETKVTGSDSSFTAEAGQPLRAEIPPGPSWLQKAVFYQVYPQSYYDSNGDGIGDLPGVTAKLDYIASIGCNAVWLNPIFESPFGDAGYDIADFYEVAPRYGTNDDFKNLCLEAHKRGLRVCIDLVAGHTSVLNQWFQESALDWPNQYSNWYIWTPAAENVTGSQPYPGQDRRAERYLPNFFAFQPALNYGYADPQASWQLPATDPACIAVREELKSII